MLGEVEPAVQGGDERRRLAGKDRERIVVEVEMQHVELVRALTHSFEHRHVQRHGVAHPPVEPESLRPDRLEPGPRRRIAAGEQRHLMPQRHQFLGQPRHDALGTAIKLRRDRFGQRGDLGDAHANGPPSIRSLSG
jgi:hypothetical protein